MSTSNTPPEWSAPSSSLARIERVFAEGANKYGRLNWQTSSGLSERPPIEMTAVSFQFWALYCSLFRLDEPTTYDKERARHALVHMARWLMGDRSEDHLAKIAWWAITAMWREDHVPRRDNNGG